MLIGPISRLSADAELIQTDRHDEAWLCIGAVDLLGPPGFLGGRRRRAARMEFVWAAGLTRQWGPAGMSRLIR